MAVDGRSRRYRAAADRVPSRAVLEFRVLGPLELVGEDGPVRLGGPRQRATLAILLLHANRVVPAERLADELHAGSRDECGELASTRQLSFFHGLAPKRYLSPASVARVMWRRSCPFPSDQLAVTSPWQ